MRERHCDKGRKHRLELSCRMPGHRDLVVWYYGAGGRGGICKANFGVGLKVEIGDVGGGRGFLRARLPRSGL